MTVEGMIHKDIAYALRMAGHDINFWVDKETPAKEAKKHDIDQDNMDEDDVYISVYIDIDLETYFHLDDLLIHIDNKEIPLLLNTHNKELKEAVERRLKRGLSPDDIIKALKENM